MPRTAAARKTKVRDEGGFTLHELSVGVAVMLIIAAAVMAFIVIAARQYSNQEERVTQTDQARNAMMRITSELRDAGAVTHVNDRTVQAEVRQADGSYHQVTYGCEGGPTSACTRADAVTGDEELLVEDVVNSNNFPLVAGSTLEGTGSKGGAIAVILELDLDDADTPITLSSAVRPRNCSSAAGVINPC
jgi:prepilin-type N-terminal cleavage/methylation domain-containing protein